MAELVTAADVARSVADALAGHRLPYAIGGAIALGFYTAPRATVDVDVNVFVSPDDEFDKVLLAMEAEGFVSDDEPDRLRQTAVEEGRFGGTVQGLRVDVFVPAIPFYARLQERRRKVVLFGRSMWIVGPEDLAILKLMFFRRKDVADVEAILRDQGSSLDRDYVRATLVGLVGDDDERVRTLDEIARDVDAER